MEALHRGWRALALATGVALLLGGPPPDQGTFPERERQLSFYHTHTGQQLDVVYWRDGRYVPAELARVDRFLSDFRTGDVVEIDPALLDLIHDVQSLVGGGTYEVISAYRSPATNEMLRRRGATSGVAEKSQHLHGKAIDVRLQGVPTAELRDAAITLGRGGVGYYAASDFVHMDTDRVRHW
ncbi:MAG: DUF882 domain-containing protein [Woeseiaceae bacterium]|nr:DUF882 domain-containing protein [Woeseiaceae bacterium]